MLWGECDDDRARHSLATALWRLQGVLKPATTGSGGRACLQVTPQYISFNCANGGWVDVAEFENRLQLAKHAVSPEQRIALYGQAVELYTGELLPDCYDDWAQEARERTQYAYLQTVEHLLTHYAGRGEHPQALEAAARILACDPLREQVHRQVMELHLAADRPASALRQYRACEQVLRRELSVEPSPELQALLTRVVAALPRASASSGSGQRSRDLGSAIARLHELAEWCEHTRLGLLEAAGVLLELGEPATVHAPR
jgi:DNA-binding SARP family transcriptional activator